ncbi:MAG: NUDIX hydrolase [Dehalococcoidia bacterium]
MSEGSPDWEGSAVLLIDPAGRVLLQQRSDDHPPAGIGRWAIPGGRREGDETPRETALREFEEETGARLARLRFFGTFTRENAPGLAVRELRLFFADDEVPREGIEVNEGLDFQYWSPAEAVELRMNPPVRLMLERFFAHDLYRGTVALKAPFLAGVSIIEMDRWGRVLLQLRDADLPADRFPSHWGLPGGLIDAGEAPDAAAIREFEEETGHLLEKLKLFRVYRREPELPGAMVDVLHVYFEDADLEEELVEVGEGQAFRYHALSDLEGLEVVPAARTVLEEFFGSTHYKALFH